MTNGMGDGALREVVKTASIFSRVTPEHKMRIVRAFKENGEIVAMAGDEVNDAPPSNTPTSALPSIRALPLPARLRT